MGLLWYLAAVAVCAGLPLVFVRLPAEVRFVLLYAHIAGLTLLSAFLSGVYLTDVAGITLPAGQVAYAGVLFTAVLKIVVARDLRVLRQIVLIVVATHLLALLMFGIAHAALSAAGVRNLLGTPASLFGMALRPILGSTLLAVAEVLLLLTILERAKTRLGRLPMTAVYLAAFAGVLLLHGALFPVLARGGEADLARLVLSGVSAAALLALSYAVPLAAFLRLNRGAVSSFARTPLSMRHLLDAAPPGSLLDLLEEVEQSAGRDRATFERVLDAADTTILVTTDADFTITHFNRGAEVVLGVTAAEVLGRTPDVLLTRARGLRPASGASAAPAATARGVLPVERWHELADGRHRDLGWDRGHGEVTVLSVSLNAVHDREQLVGYLVTGEDITVRAHAEEARAESVKRLQEADRVKDELVSTISHELRTPITSIQGYTELIADAAYGAVSPEQAEALVKVERNVGRLQALVDDLLFVARGEDEQDRLAAVTLDLREPVTAAWTTVEQLATGRGLRLGCAVPDHPVRVLGDAGMLERLVLNLGGNAVKFTPEGGVVELALRTVDGVAELRIGDTGIGIPQEDLTRVFDRFFRSAEANARQIAGSGLGLSVAQRIVALHGATLRLDSVAGRGTTATVRLAVAP